MKDWSIKKIAIVVAVAGAVLTALGIVCFIVSGISVNAVGEAMGYSMSASQVAELMDQSSNMAKMLGGSLADLLGVPAIVLFLLRLTLALRIPLVIIGGAALVAGVVMLVLSGSAPEGASKAAAAGEKTTSAKPSAKKASGKRMVRCGVCGRSCSAKHSSCPTCGVKFDGRNCTVVGGGEREVPAKTPVPEKTVPAEKKAPIGEEKKAPVMEKKTPADKTPVFGFKETAADPAPERGDVVCPNCGKTYHEKVVFCSDCGCRLPEPKPYVPPKPKGLCDACGKQNSPEARFCSACGNLLNAAEPVAATPFVEAAPPFAVEEPVEAPVKAYEEVIVEPVVPVAVEEAPDHALSRHTKEERIAEESVPSAKKKNPYMNRPSGL